jgi:hypothetical protein
MYSHQRENWFPRLHAAACLAGTYVAFVMLPLVNPKSISEIPAEVLIPAALLVPFFASLISFVLFAPASLLLYRFGKRFDCRSWGCHCLGGMLCVTLTLVAILFAGFVISKPENAEASGGLDTSSPSQERLFFMVYAVSGAAGGTAFYFARKMTIPQTYTNGGTEW